MGLEEGRGNEGARELSVFRSFFQAHLLRQVISLGPLQTHLGEAVGRRKARPIITQATHSTFLRSNTVLCEVGTVSSLLSLE